MPKALTITRTAAVTAAVLLLAACSGGQPAGHAQSTATTTGTPAGTRASLPAPLPPGFSARGNAGLPRISVLQVAPVTTLNPRALHPGSFPAAQIRALAQAIANQPVPVTVRPLLVSVSTLQPGESFVAAAGELPATPHDVLFVLQGPGERAQRLVRVVHGVSVGVVTLPGTLGPGTWALAAEDLSGVHARGNGRPTGTVLLDMTIFVVA